MSYVKYMKCVSYIDVMNVKSYVNYISILWITSNHVESLKNHLTDLF